MKFDNIKEKFVEIYELIMDVEFTENASMSNCAEWDSLKQVALIAEIEDKIDLEIEFEDILEMTSVKKILGIFKKKCE